MMCEGKTINEVRQLTASATDEEIVQRLLAALDILRTKHGSPEVVRLAEQAIKHMEGKTNV